MGVKVDHIPPSEGAIAEASVWLARLRGESRTEEVETGFRVWLAASEENRTAFDSVTQVWDVAGGLKRRPERAARPQKAAWRPALLAACLALVCLGGFWQWQQMRFTHYTTEVGELRSVRLTDGSIVQLNTNTRLKARFTNDKRLLVLEEGEASFDVVKDSLRPFLIEAGESQVLVVGTQFDVRWTEGALSVTLADGKVRVIDETETDLVPGQRLMIRAAGQEPVLDTVNIKAARAWKKGQVVFDSAPLIDALGEMNRYSKRKLVFAGDHAGDYLISGAFRAGDMSQFGRALSDLYGFSMAETESSIVLKASENTQ